MEIIIFEKEAYYQMQKDMLRLVKQAIKEAKLEAIEEASEEASPENDWVAAEEAKKLLGIKSKKPYLSLN